MYFEKLNKSERIEVMRLSLETLIAIKELPKTKGDVVDAVKGFAEAYAIYLYDPPKAS